MIRKPNGEVEFTPDEEAEMIKCEYENYCAWYDTLTPEEQAAEDEFHRKSFEGKIMNILTFTSRERHSHTGSLSRYSFVETDYIFTNPNLIVHRTKYDDGKIFDTYTFGTDEERKLASQSINKWEIT